MRDVTTQALRARTHALAHRWCATLADDMPPRGVGGADILILFGIVTYANVYF